MVISDFIGSPGFAGDHLGFFSHRIGSPGAADDYLGILSASWLSPGLTVTLSDSLAPQGLLRWLFGFLDLLLSVVLSRRQQHSLLISLGFSLRLGGGGLVSYYPFFV